MSREPQTGDSDSLIEQLFSDREFESLDDLNAQMSLYMTMVNQRPVDEFGGLSPDEVYQMTYYPFEASDLVTFDDSALEIRRALAFRMLVSLMNHIGDEGVKATSTGNLPTSICTAMMHEFSNEVSLGDYYVDKKRILEKDFFELHVIKLCATLARLIRKYRGKYVLTRAGKSLLQEENHAVLYLMLFQTYARQFNWAYLDAYEPLTYIQTSFCVSLHFLHQSGATWLHTDYYGQKFVEAFPLLLDETYPNPDGGPIKRLISIYTLRFFERFAYFFGLIEKEIDQKEHAWEMKFRVRKSPLFEQFIHFHTVTSLD